MEKMRRPEGNGSLSEKDVIPRSELWADGLICAFEFVQSEGKSKSERHFQIQQRQKTEGNHQQMQVPFNGEIDSSSQNVQDNATYSDVCGISGKTPQSFSNVHEDCQYLHSPSSHKTERSGFSHWRPIGWNRISELVQSMEPHLTWASQQYPLENCVDNLTVVDLAAPYWEQPGGSTWWCHVSADHPSIIAWLSNAQWLHPAVSIALRDESRLISERMKYLFYEVPVRVAGGLLFELLGQSVGDPYIEEDDLPVVIRSWQAQNFLVTALHVKGSRSRMNVLGVIEVQELLFAGGCNVPRSSHELIAQLASRLTRWDDRSLRVTHNLAVFGGCGLVLSIITGLFGINVDGIPGAENTPFAFGLFTAILFCIGIVLIVVGLLYLGLKKPLREEQVEVRKLELQDLVKMFQHEAETHAQVRKSFSRQNLPPTAADLLPTDAEYFLIA